MAAPPSFRATRQRAPGKNLHALMEHMQRLGSVGWDGALQYNDLTNVVEVRTPWPPKAGHPKADPEPLDEVDHVLVIQDYFQRNDLNAGKSVVFDALQLKARDRRYHPVRDYLDSLTWDQKPRLERFCEDYLGAVVPAGPEGVQHRTYLGMVGRFFCTSAVARIYRPGCKVDTVPVIVGENQGEKKSQALRALCVDDRWFTDNIGSAIDKDTKEALSGKWLVELAEMQILKSHPEGFKSFITTTVDRYRPAYGRVTTDYPRQCVLIGTANDLVLPDDSGNRRFWPFRISQINLPAIIRDRDQLWAEAVSLFLQGHRWWTDNPTDETFFRDAQENFAEYDVWEGLIYQWVSAQPNAFRTDDVLEAVSALTSGRPVTKQDQMRLASCLKRMGYQKRRLRKPGANANWWSLKP
jgi:putative DNA primase/helicase